MAGVSNAKGPGDITRPRPFVWEWQRPKARAARGFITRRADWGKRA
jgi:hypothetical protein